MPTSAYFQPGEMLETLESIQERRQRFRATTEAPTVPFDTIGPPMASACQPHGPMTQLEAFGEATRRWGSRAAVSSRAGQRGTVFRVGEGPDFPEDSIEPVFYLRWEGGSWEEAFAAAGPGTAPPANPTPCTLEDALAAMRMIWGPRAFVRLEAADGGRPPHCVVGIADAMGWELISQRAGDWTYAIRMLQEKIARLAPVLATGALRGTVHKR